MMNFTILAVNYTHWSLDASELFAPVYPKSIRGTSNNQRGDPGDR